jgi:antitoxin (DNA-binding transcriptional repressor) of toxin-antitoxin stability system
MSTTTVTVRQLRHDLKSVEKALTKGPVKVTKRGKVVWTISAAKRPAKAALKATKWTPEAHTARLLEIVSNKTEVINVLDYL